MNVGSILNNDSPPSDNETAPAAPKRPDFSQQRHSLVNLLNDPAPERSPTQYSSNSPQVTPSKEHEEYKVPKPVTSSPYRSPMMKRNSIANITNDRDVDINTGETTLNISRKSSMSESDIKEIREEKTEDEKEEKPEVAEKEIKEAPKEEVKAPVENKKPVPTEGKPRRYERPPIWAQECGPGAFQSNGGAANHQESNNDQINGDIGTTSVLSSKPVYDPSHTESVDLECSITGIIPPPSVTRTIAEWIYANFTEIPDDKRKHVELELKFGTIIDKRAGHRIDINVLTECIFTDTSSTYFDIGVHEVGWTDMCKFLDDLERTYQEDQRKSQPQLKVPKRKFNNLESDITDTFYQIVARNEQPKTIRISKENQLNPPRYTAINKQRISDLFIHNPSSMYDLRLSLSFENPIPEADIESILKKQTPTLTRVKKRSSWSHRPTVTRFDMTRVLQPRELKNKMGKKIIEQDQSFEVELEIDVPELFTGFDLFKSGLNLIRFEELVEIFVNNARCMNNRVTKLANK